LAIAGFALAAKKDAGAPRGAHRAAAPAASASAPIASAPVAPSSRAPEEAPSWASCAEHVPSGVTKPVLADRFPARATSGYAAALEITVEHGKGETVLPQGFQVQSNGDAARSLAEAGFLFPDATGGAGPTLHTMPNATGAVTKIE